MKYLITDQFRLADLHRMDTTAETVADAKAAAEAMARKYRCRVYVISVVGEVEGAVEPRWTKDPAPPATTAAMPGGWFGMVAP